MLRLMGSSVIFAVLARSCLFSESETESGRTPGARRA